MGFNTGDLIKIKKEYRDRKIAKGIEAGKVINVLSDTMKIEVTAASDNSIIGKYSYVPIEGCTKLKWKPSFVIYAIDDKVYCKDANGNKGSAIYAPEDKYDFLNGARIAFKNMMNDVIEKGDIVKVINTGYLRTEYIECAIHFADSPQELAQFAYGDSLGYPDTLISDRTFKVLKMQDFNDVANLCYIQDAVNNKCYIIQAKGLEKVKSAH